MSPGEEMLGLQKVYDFARSDNPASSTSYNTVLQTVLRLSTLHLASLVLQGLEKELLCRVRRCAVVPYNPGPLDKTGIWITAGDSDVAC